MDRVHFEPVREAIELERMRLDACQQALWPEVLSGSTAAIDVYIRLAKRRADLLGLDAPKSAQASVQITGPSARQLEVMAQIEKDNNDPMLAARVLAELEAAGAFGTTTGAQMIDVTPQQVEEPEDERPWEPGPRGMGSRGF
jgi:hypothetical protein